MLLIMFLGLIAKIALVCGGCDVGPSIIKDFNFNEFAGPQPWYVFRIQNENALRYDCVAVQLEYPKGDTSLVKYTSDGPAGSFTYSATNWNGTGWDEVGNNNPSIISRYYVVAVDYCRYVILKYCIPGTNKVVVEVWFRMEHPDCATKKEVKEKLKASGIDDIKFDHIPASKCKKV